MKLATALILSTTALTSSASYTTTIFYSHSGGGDNETHKLLPANGASGDQFGKSVAVSGSTAIVGSRWDDEVAPNAGAAYTYDTSTGDQVFKLTSSDGTRGDAFGSAVAIDGNIALVGASHDDENGPQSGSAYLFDTTTGAQLFKLLPDDGATEDFFGFSVSISGTTAIVGAPHDADNGSDSGSAYLFDTTTGLQLAKVLPDDGAPGDNFGFSVGISGATAIAGAFFRDEHGPRSGAAYLFDTASGSQTLKLVPADGAMNDEFGFSVAVSGNTALVGSVHDDDHGSNSGSAYLFDTTSGVQVTKLTADDAAPEARFGSAVALMGAIAIVGAERESGNGVNSGAAYLFDTTAGGQITKLSSSDGAAGDNCGHSVSINGTTAIAGAWRNEENGVEAGVAYLFDVPGPVITSYCFGDGTGTPCPCGNTGGPGEGCANSTGSGAVLTISGSASVSADDLVLTSTGLPAGPGLFFQGQNSINSGNGIVFGDGLRCAGLDVTRLQVRFSSGGSSNTSISIATKGAVSAGDTKRYQEWYRDPSNSPCGSTFNLTNGYELTWTL